MIACVYRVASTETLYDLDSPDNFLSENILNLLKTALELASIQNIGAKLDKNGLFPTAVCGAAIVSNPTCSKQLLDTQKHFNADTQMILAAVKSIRWDWGCHIRDRQLFASRGTSIAELSFKSSKWQTFQRVDQSDMEERRPLSN